MTNEPVRVYSLTRDTIRMKGVGQTHFWNPVFKVINRHKCLCVLNELVSPTSGYVPVYVTNNEKDVGYVNKYVLTKLLSDDETLAWPYLSAVDMNQQGREAVRQFERYHGLSCGTTVRRIFAKGLPFVYDGGIQHYKNVVWELLEWRQERNAALVRPYPDVVHNGSASKEEIEIKVETFVYKGFGIDFFPFVLSACIHVTHSQSIYRKTNFSSFVPLRDSAIGLKDPVFVNTETLGCQEVTCVCHVCQRLHVCDLECGNPYDPERDRGTCPLDTYRADAKSIVFHMFDDRTNRTIAAEGGNPLVNSVQDSKAAGGRKRGGSKSVVTYKTNDVGEKKKKKKEKEYIGDGASETRMLVRVVKRIADEVNDSCWGDLCSEMETPNPNRLALELKTDIQTSYNLAVKTGKIADTSYLMCRVIRSCLEKKKFLSDWYEKLLDLMPHDSQLSEFGLGNPGKKTRSYLRKTNKAVFMK